MHRFLYGSRVIENERVASMESKFLKAGSIIHGVVRFLSMFFAICMLNILLSNLTRHTTLVTVNSLRALEEGISLLINDSTLSVITFAYHHMFTALFAIVCFAVVFTLTVSALCFKTVGFVGVKGSRVHSDAQKDRKASCAVSYKFKVCFLS